MYEDWHTVLLELRVTQPIFDNIRNWCYENCGSPLNRPTHLWDWGTNRDYNIWFVFKNKEDCVKFVLTWGDNVKLI